MFYIFDFDGTLVDSMPYWGNTHIEALLKHGIECPENFVETITPLGNQKAVEYAFSLGVKANFDEYLNFINNKLLEKYSTVVPLKEFVKETLTKLKAQGHSLNVLTASPHLYVDNCLKRLDVFDCFDNIWTIEDFAHTKAETIIYNKVAEKLNTTVHDCTFVDDNFTAILTAQKAGMKTIAIFDKSSKNSELELQKTADKYIYNFNEML